LPLGKEISTTSILRFSQPWEESGIILLNKINWLGFLLSRACDFIRGSSPALPLSEAGRPLYPYDHWSLLFIYAAHDFLVWIKMRLELAARARSYVSRLFTASVKLSCCCAWAILYSPIIYRLCAARMAWSYVVRPALLRTRLYRLKHFPGTHYPA
jgi:hypothetical protein